MQRVAKERPAEPPVDAELTGDAARRAADEAEVARVLGALTDADVLGLRPRASPDAAKRAFRALAKKLHPDKSTAPRAGAAFQRIMAAYQRLTA